MKKKFARTRKMRDEEADTEGTWAISYGDMVTLLLTFFILFFSLNPDAKSQAEKSQKDAIEKQQKALQAALIKSLDSLSMDNTKKGKTESVDNEPSKLGQTEKSESPENPENIKGQKTLASTSAAEDKQIEGDSKAILELPNGVLYQKGQKIILDFPGVSFFNSGKIPLTSKGKDALQKFTEKYTSYMGNFQLSIHAYADTKKVRDNPNNKFTDNLELSALRGIAAMRFLQTAGIPLKRMKVAGYGELELTMADLATLETEAQTKANLLNLARRVVLVIEPEERN
jgi:chemotaxis protein MotB